jgi:glycerate kinase
VAWDISLSSGALAVAKMIGLENVVADCDLVITGEGRLDSQSNSGKVVGTVEEIASRHGKRVNYCVGSSELPLGERGVALIDITPSFHEAISNSKHWLIAAGKRLAQQQPS